MSGGLGSAPRAARSVGGEPPSRREGGYLQIIRHAQGKDGEASALGTPGMEGPQGGVGQEGARVGGRALETLALRHLRRGGHHAAHVRRPLHHGPALELPEHHRANPAADFHQERIQGCLCHVRFCSGCVSGGHHNEGPPHCIAVTGWKFRQSILQIIFAGVVQRQEHPWRSQARNVGLTASHNRARHVWGDCVALAGLWMIEVVGYPALRAGPSNHGLPALPNGRSGRFGRAVSPGVDSPGQRPGNEAQKHPPALSGRDNGAQHTVTPGGQPESPFGAGGGSRRDPRYPDGTVGGLPCCSVRSSWLALGSPCPRVSTRKYIVLTMNWP
ncbi:MAG: hypothetical protein RJA22_1754 [Verrucomicrobiota bacterium]